jgi:hypothetical protein
MSQDRWCIKGYLSFWDHRNGCEDLFCVNIFFGTSEKFHLPEYREPDISPEEAIKTGFPQMLLYPVGDSNLDKEMSSETLLEAFLEQNRNLEWTLDR